MTLMLGWSLDAEKSQNLWRIENPRFDHDYPVTWPFDLRILVGVWDVGVVVAVEVVAVAVTVLMWRSEDGDVVAKLAEIFEDEDGGVIDCLQWPQENPDGVSHAHCEYHGGHD